ncbi:hypothetical protein FB45DRAFT_1018218 [Roridomyces roridus]|uniref:Uncharacterized protein n=1 Tax=Roridomyces roridus TaxID=1738132 RepID=A0AAD7FYY8_9AGAR|nr:hypothetical protein FB45DRAFT_1018218 [Roridomyces roridus]
MISVMTLPPQSYIDMKFILALSAALISAITGLNLVNDAPPGEDTAVTGLPVSFSTQLNQEWSLIAQGSNFIIANALNSTLKLSYPTAPFGGNPHFAGLIVSEHFPATFSLQTVSGNGVRIVEVTSGHTLTSWATAGNSAQSPVRQLVSHFDEFAIAADLDSCRILVNQTNEYLMQSHSV